MQFQFKINVGENEITITETAENQAEFVEKIAFYSGLPTEGPNGEKDLKFVFRTTKEGYKYYSLVSESAGQEFTFGQSQKKPGELFNKGWEPIFQSNNQQQQQAPQQQNMPQQQATPQPQQNIQNQPVQPQALAQQAAPAQPQVPPQTQQNQQVANDVLAKFGITN